MRTSQVSNDLGVYEVDIEDEERLEVYELYRENEELIYLVVKWSESEVKVKVPEQFFGLLIFFVIRYVKGEVLGYNNIGIKTCKTTFLWVLNFGKVGELPQ